MLLADLLIHICGEGIHIMRNQNIFLHFKKIMSIVKVLGIIFCVLRLSLKILSAAQMSFFF